MAEKSLMAIVRPKLIVLILSNIVVWLFNKFLYTLPNVFMITFSVFSLLCFIVLVLFDKRPTTEWGGGKAVANIILIIVSGIIVFVPLWYLLKHYGYPDIFIWTAIIFAWLFILMLVVLDLKPMKEATGVNAIANLILFYIIVGGGYTLVGFALPQYDPKVEIEGKLIKKKIDLATADKATILAMGADVFKNFECFNCHNAEPGGTKKRGPNLGEIDMGGEEKVRTNIVDPQKEISKGFEIDPKVAKAMPTYYGEQMTKDELTTIIAYLVSFGEKMKVSTDKMPEGWWTDPAILEEGKKIFEGEKSEDVACHACHGKDGVPLMTEAMDFRDAKIMSALDDAKLFHVVAEGKEETQMSGWKDFLPAEDIWKVIAYLNQFHSGGKPHVHAAGEKL
jgi:mono/diheme cytochrome c family protein